MLQLVMDVSVELVLSLCLKIGLFHHSVLILLFDSFVFNLLLCEGGYSDS